MLHKWMPPLHNRFIRYQLRRLFNHISTMEAVCIQVYSRPHSRIHCIKRPAHTHNHLCHRLLVYHHMRAANTGDQLRPLHNNINRYLKASFNCSLNKSLWNRIHLDFILILIFIFQFLAISISIISGIIWLSARMASVGFAFPLFSTKIEKDGNAGMRRTSHHLTVVKKITASPILN